MDYSSVGTIELDDIIRSHQDEIAELRRQLAGKEYVLRQALRELERRLKKDVTR
jgi:predicted transcriptional regulator